MPRSFDSLYSSCHTPLRLEMVANNGRLRYNVCEWRNGRGRVEWMMVVRSET